MLIDTHCHLYLPEFVQDIEQVIERAVANDVQRFYLPAIDSETHEAVMALEKKFPGRCFAMMGLHPCSVKEDPSNELAIVASYLSAGKFAAIGETGLDLYWDKTHFEQQVASLHRHIEWALQYQLPIVLHTRNATKEVIDEVTKYKGSGLYGVFHCFGGTAAEAQQVIDLQFYLGIGGVITYKNGGLDKILADIDLAHLVLETDSPYLSPVPYRGKRNESAYLKEIAIKLAAVKNCSIEEVMLTTSNNANKLFKFEQALPTIK